MSIDIMIVFIVGIIMIACFCSGKLSYPAVAVSVIVILEATGILSASEAWSGFASNTAVLFASMFVLAAGLSKTSLLSKLATIIVPEGSSERRAVIGCGLLSIFLTIFSNTSSTMATMMPICFNVAQKAGISPKRLLKPAVDLSSIWAAVLPVGIGLTAYSVSNELVSSLGGEPTFTVLTFMSARLPIVFLVTLFVFFVGYKFTPSDYDNLVMEGMISKVSTEGKNKPALTAGKEKLTYIIFVCAIVAMIMSSYVKAVSASTCAAIAALLMVFTGILSEKEAMRAINLKVIGIYAGTIALANAISASGANEVISDFMNQVLGGVTNPYLMAFILMIGTTTATQFMNNSSTLNIFRILGAVVAVACGFDARSALIAVEMGATCSVLTPMASATQAMVFAQGGYTMKQYFKCGFPVFVLYVALYMIYVPNAFPAI
ncbi:MAG: SLC13 family permease [Eubacteriales bacterium]|nr:SLC13 family permease [Eubacteriales bacterium]